MKKIIFLIAVIAIVWNSHQANALTIGFDNTNVQYEKVKNNGKLKTTVYKVSPSSNLDTGFWARVQNSLQTGPVDIIFADDSYLRTSTLIVNSIGHNSNLLTLKSAKKPGGAVFTGAIANLLKFTDCRNLLIQGLKFTGDASGYAVTFTNSKNIVIDNCYFVDLQKVFYGALGVHTNSDNVIVKNCTFNRVGVDSHAHLVYGAYGVTRLKLINNVFTDCSGAFVRFRGNLSTHGVVYGNTFTSTGTYAGGVNPGFVEVPVFNDVNPGDERFGTSFMVTKNRFNYSTSGKQNTRFAMVFHHSGFNPPDRIHLITPEDASILNNGTVEQKRAILLAKPGIDGKQVLFAGNTNTNVEYMCFIDARVGMEQLPHFRELLTLNLR